MHAQSEHFNLNPLIQLPDATQYVNEMKSLSLIGAQWEHRSNTHICIGEDGYFCANIEYFVCFHEPQGELDYRLQDQDNVVFISTLHGG